MFGCSPAAARYLSKDAVCPDSIVSVLAHKGRSHRTVLDLCTEAEAAATRHSCPRVRDYLTDARLQCLIDAWTAADSESARMAE